MAVYTMSPRAQHRAERAARESVAVGIKQGNAQGFERQRVVVARNKTGKSRRMIRLDSSSGMRYYCC